MKASRSYRYNKKELLQNSTNGVQLHNPQEKKETENGESSLALHSDLTTESFGFKMSGRFHSESVQVTAFAPIQTFRPSLIRH